MNTAHTDNMRRGFHVGFGEGQPLSAIASQRGVASQVEIKAGPEKEMRFGVMHSSFPPGAGFPFLHVHRSYDEAFYVIEGDVQFQLGPEEIHARAGSAIFVPPGVPHCFRNIGSSNVSWIVLTAPALGITMISDCAAVLRGDLDALAEVMERYDSELLERRPHWDA